MGDNRYIGVFDSGIGGLTVLREIISALPSENIVYLGDTARLPYGTKPKSTIIQYALQAARFFDSYGVKALVVACHTVSAVAMPYLFDKFKLPMIGVVEPSARLAVESTKNNKIGVIGTQATIASGVYSSFIKRLNNKMAVFTRACPLLVPLVEEGWLDKKVTEAVLAEYLSKLRRRSIDTLILGCTHYPFLASIISQYMGESVTIIEPSRILAAELVELLEKRGIIGQNIEGRRIILLTAVSEASKKQIFQFLNQRSVIIRKVDLV